MKEETQVKTIFSKRFWSKVQIGPETECWNWTASTQSKGYGSFGIGGGKTALAHRVAYQLTKGPIPEGLLVRHHCDNRICCNPAHLETGTIADNNRDAVLRGRTAKGERNGRAKLSMEQVAEIRRLRNEESLKISELAQAYKMHPKSISNIVKERYWKLPEAQ
ncbi:MAG: HNH endonuclease [Anaerolineales bacterium]|nr:HNH endonuclease [Anaerolineales bacterium]